MTRPVNAEGVALTKSFEGCELTSYPDPGTGGAPWTIGWGHTGTFVRKGQTITQGLADQCLVQDLAKAGEAVERLVKVPLSDNQFAALADFVFNLGAGTLSASTLLRRLNDGEYSGVPMQLMRFNKAHGKVMAGLTRRCAARVSLWSKI